MMDIQFTRAAQKDIKSKSLRAHADKALGHILTLKQDPWKGHPLSKNLKGVRSLKFNLPGSGAYRAAYVVLEEQEVCLIFMLGPHEGFYEQAVRRYQELKKRL